MFQNGQMKKKWNTYTHLIARETESVYKSGRMTFKNK